MEKERVYLTDITLHTREYRQTLNFSNVAQKGRMYSPLPKDYVKNIKVEGDNNGDGKFAFKIELPKDLMEKIEGGEAELMMPEGGLLIYAGRDVYDFIEANKEKERRELIHRNRGNTWHVDRE